MNSCSYVKTWPFMTLTHMQQGGMCMAEKVAMAERGEQGQNSHMRLVGPSKGTCSRADQWQNT